MKLPSTQMTSLTFRNTLAGLLASAAPARRAMLSVVVLSMIANHSQLLAQTEAVPKIAVQGSASVPQLVRFSGALVDSRGWPITTPTAVTFAIYAQATGEDPAPLWQERQQISPNNKGSYTVLLGSVSPGGIPVVVFQSGESQYLSVKADGESEQVRVLLVSVPYAMKAGDAATLGGLPASAYALAETGNIAKTAAATPAVAPPVATDVTTTGGTSGYLPVFNAPSTIIDSPLFVSGVNVGIGTTAPAVPLDVVGSTILEGAVTVGGSTGFYGPLTLESSGTATASTGFDSQVLKIYTSAFNSSSKTAVNPRFEWQAVPQGNDTATQSLTLNLLSSVSSASATQTGFYFNANGTLNFAPAQAFPANSAAFPANSVGSAYFGGAGSSSSTGTGNTGTGNEALVSNTAGVANTASGVEALAANTTGNRNTASGSLALELNTTGSDNTGMGDYAGNTIDQSAGTGSNNTALGYSSAFANGSLTNATAIGAYAEVDSSNSLILGCVPGKNACPGAVVVGIGTASPAYELEVYGSNASNAELAMVSNGTDAAISVNNTNTANGGREYWIDSGSKGAGIGEGNFAIYDKAASATRMLVTPSGHVGVNATPTGAQFQVSSAVSSTITAAIYAQFGTFTAVESEVPGAIVADGGTTSSPGGSQVAVVGAASDNDAAVFYNDSANATPTLVLENAGPGQLLSAVGNFGTTQCIIDGGADLDCTGTISGSAKHFKIDHPLDPANKYLIHASVESSEMMNIYTGNVITDELGLATVQLPDWFEAENGDFRYQLTVVDERFAQAVVSKKIQNGQFTIHTNATNVEVSWQITAVRQDAYARANPLVVEQVKPAAERGFYQHPELYGQPRQKQTQWARDPKMMERMEAQRAAKARQANGGKPQDAAAIHSAGSELASERSGESLQEAAAKTQSSLTGGKP